MATYYINGTTLANSTAVFTNAAMTSCANDGFYSDGNIVREQVNCSLLPAVQCQSCNLPCGSTIFSVNIANAGYFRIGADTGATPTDVGAVLIYFKTTNIPDGIRVKQGGINYNKLTSSTFGYAASADPNGITYTGATGATGTCPTNFGVSTINETTNNYDYVNGNVLPSGGATTLQIQPTDVILDTFNGFYMMVVPKTTNFDNILDIEIHSPCSTSDWELKVKCPVLLTGVPTANVSDCSETTFPLTYYNAPNDETSFGEPSLHDFIFNDAYGENKMSAGNYTINPPSGKKLMTVDANGVITSLTNCP